MKGMAAVKKYIGTQGTNPEMIYTEPKVSEMKEFMDICTSEEKAEYGKFACAALGVPYDS